MSWSGYIPGSLLGEDLWEDYEVNRENDFWDTHQAAVDSELWMSRNGGRTASEAYPMAGLSLPYEGYPTAAEPRRSLDVKWAGRVSPYGTPLAVLARDTVDLGRTLCGHCQVWISQCECGFKTTKET